MVVVVVESVAVVVLVGCGRWWLWVVVGVGCGGVVVVAVVIKSPLILLWGAHSNEPPRPARAGAVVHCHGMPVRAGDGRTHKPSPPDRARPGHAGLW